MAKYVIVRTADNKITNVVEWDGDTAKWQPPAGHTAMTPAAALVAGATPIEPPPPIDLSNLDNLENAFKALAELLRLYTNAPLPVPPRTRAQVKADFMAIYNAL